METLLSGVVKPNPLTVSFLLLEPFSNWKVGERITGPILYCVSPRGRGGMHVGWVVSPILSTAVRQISGYTNNFLFIGEGRNTFVNS